jgi:hypothetical protein
MPHRASRSALAALALVAASAAVAAPADKQKPLTHTTLQTGLPRAPEQEAVVFEKADLAFKVEPAKKRLTGDAVADVPRAAIRSTRSWWISIATSTSRPSKSTASRCPRASGRTPKAA